MNNILVKILNNNEIQIPSSFCLTLDLVNTLSESPQKFFPQKSNRSIVFLRSL